MTLPVSPEDVIARAAGEFEEHEIDADDLATALLVALARAGFVVVPSQPDADGKRRALDAYNDGHENAIIKQSWHTRTGTSTPIRAAAHEHAVECALDAFLAPYRSTENQ